jgi:hypothetical protein
MTDQPISPAGQAVLDAVASQMEGGWISPDFISYEAKKIAAALRAAADQVVPETEEPRNQLEYELGVWDARDDVRGGLLAIAAELEGGND